MDDTQDVMRLYEEAQQKLGEREFAAAMELGERLKQLRFSGSFEILALARAGQNDLEGAVAELRQGVEVAPKVWLLWHLLGDLLSDLSRYDEALDALAQALSCPQADASVIHYNRALVLRRAERNEEALSALDMVTEGEVLRWATMARPEFLHALGRYDAALWACEAALPKLEEEHDRARVRGDRALILLDGKGDAEGARQEAQQAVGNGDFSQPAAEVLRRVRGVTSTAGLLYHLRVRGYWPEGAAENPTGFLRGFHVVADTPEQALDYASAFEPEDARESLAIDDAETQPAPDRLHGVYWASGRIFYPVNPERSEDAGCGGARGCAGCSGAH